MVHIEERGQGPCVVLLHGSPTSPTHMLPLADRLARTHRTFVVHLPGYGRSAPLDPYSMTRSHVVVEEALRARGCSDCHFVGFASGAYRAIALAVRGALGVRSIASLGGLVDFPPSAGARLARYIRMLRSGADPAPVLEEMALSPRGRENPTWVGEVRGWATAIAPENLARELEAFIGAAGLRQELGALDVPVLARVGSIDAATTPERSRSILAVARDVVFEEVPGVGHALLCEDFDATAASVERHLARRRS